MTSDDPAGRGPTAPGPVGEVGPAGGSAGPGEAQGRDRFPGGAEPLLGPVARRRAGRAGVFVANLVFFGLFTTLFAAWWPGEQGRSDDITVLAILARGTPYALVMLGFSLWTERRKRRR